jgi:hypothetical protein
LSREKLIFATIVAEINEVKIIKIDTCNFEDNLFDDKLIIVNCIVDLDNKNEYKIKAIINNNCINYSFININIAHKICELLRISSLKLNKSREVKKNDEKRSKISLISFTHL